MEIQKRQNNIYLHEYIISKKKKICLYYCHIGK